MKKVYMSDIEGPMSSRGRLIVRWKDRVKRKCMKVTDRKGRIELTRRECLDRERWKLFYSDHPIGGRFLRERDVRNYR